mgnify:CR=1 FL=1
MNPEENIIIEEPFVEEEAPQEEPVKEEESTISLEEAIKDLAHEDEAPQSTTFSLRKILLGDILNTGIVKKQIWLLLLITAFVIASITCRYKCQQSTLKIDKLQKELTDAKFRALTSSSQLTEKCRESNVLEMLKNNKDSVLHHPNQPPYIINIPQ